jgi:hypothetical protein
LTVSRAVTVGRTRDQPLLNVLVRDGGFIFRRRDFQLKGRLLM